MRTICAAALVIGIVVAAATEPLGDDHGARPAWEAHTATMRAMHHSMESVQSLGQPDADFVALMIPHHRAAIEMARTELLYGTDPIARRLAQEILVDQQSEIEVMELWQRRR
jgi:uncharacterized protein (DUF305 family)